MGQIRNQWIVFVAGKFQILYATATEYFVTTNGGFGQRDTYIQKISDEEAWKLRGSKPKKPSK